MSGGRSEGLMSDERSEGLMSDWRAEADERRPALGRKLTAQTRQNSLAYRTASLHSNPLPSEPVSNRMAMCSGLTSGATYFWVFLDFGIS